MKGNYARAEGFFPIFPKWAAGKEWLKKSLTREQVVEVGVMIVTVLLLCMLFCALITAMHNYTITGP